MKAIDFKENLPALKAAYTPVKETTGMTFNEFLMSLYRKETGQTEFETFNSWKSKGFKVKKGESSYPIFSRPIGAIKAEKSGGNYTPSEGEMKFFGICHLFHAGQVEPIVNPSNN